MKKRLILALLSMMAFSFIWGQMIDNEGFEGASFPPPGWQLQGAVTRLAPPSGTGGAYGNYSVFLVDNTVGLIAPKMANPYSITLSAYQVGTGNCAPRYFWATDLAGPWTVVETFTNISNGVWSTQTVGVGLTNVYLKIGFKHPANQNHPNCYIDNITITPSDYEFTYRSIASGNWNDITTWQYTRDGVIWYNANVPPTAAGSVSITVQNGHTVTVATSTDADQLTVASGGTLTINNGATLTLNNGTGDDLTLNGNLNIAGTLVNTGTTMVCGSSSTVTFNGTSAQSTGSGFPASVNNLVVNNSAGLTLTNPLTVNAALTLTSGDVLLGENALTLPGTASGAGSINYNGTGRASGTGISSNTNFIISQTGTNTITMPATIGNLQVNSTGSVTMGGSTSVQALTLTTGMSIGATTLTVNGAISGSGTLTGGATSNLTIAGTSAATAIPAVTLNNLSITRPNGATMGGNITVGGNLALTSGALSIGANTLTLNGTVSGTSGLTGGATSSITVGGSGAMTVPAVSSLYDLNITRVATVALGSTVTVNHNLNLASGTIVNSTASNTLTFASGATASGSGTVTGYVKQNPTTVNASSTYNNMYVGLGLTAGTSSVTSLDVLKTDLANNVGGNNSISRSWTMSGTTSTPAAVTFSWPTTADNGNSFGYGTVWCYNGSTWTRVSTQTVTTASGVHTITFNSSLGSSCTYTVLAANPVISASTGSLSDFGLVKVGTTSANSSFTTSAVELHANLVVTAPTGYQVSTSPSSGFGSSVSLTPTNGTVPSTTIYTRFAPGTVGAISGNIALTSDGTTTVNVAVSGTGIDNPVVSNPTSASVTANSAVLGGTVTNINYSNVTTRGIYYSTTNGFADGDGTPVSQSGTFGAEAFTVNVGSLSSNTTYYYKAFATNAAGTSYTSQGTFTTAYVSSAGDYYRTIATGDWGTISIWESSPDGINWYPATASPDYQSLGILIQTGTSVTVTSNITIDQCTMESGAGMTVSNNATVSLNNGTGTDFVINGTLTMTSGAISAGSGSLSYGSTAALIYNGTASQTVCSEWLNTMTIPITNNNSSTNGLVLNESKIINNTTLTNNGVLNVLSYNISGSGEVINNGRIVSDASLPVSTTTFTQNYTSFIHYTTDVTLPSGFTYQNLEISSPSATYTLSGNINVNEAFFTDNNAALNLNGFRMIFPFKYVSVGGFTTITAFDPETYVELPGNGGVARKWTFTGAPAVTPNIYLHWDND